MFFRCPSKKYDGRVMGSRPVRKSVLYVYEKALFYSVFHTSSSFLGTRRTGEKGAEEALQMRFSKLVKN